MAAIDLKKKQMNCGYTLRFYDRVRSDKLSVVYKEIIAIRSAITAAICYAGL
jgi:hypothetical protein